MSYQTLTTNLGLAKIAAAIGSGQTISLPAIKLGDGNGNPVTPSPTQIDLVRVVYTGATNSLTASPTNPNRITAELVVPASVGGFTVREAGIYDAAGVLIFVCNFPNVYKPLPSEGASRDLVIRIVFEVANSGVINLVIDTNVTVATRAWVTSNFTLAALLPGGTTYQILRKKSNTPGDTEWVDPASGQNVIVDVIEENQILASGQTIVDLVTANTNSTAVYIEGVRLRNNQFSINTETRFTLAQSYPAGSRVTIVQNEPNGAISQATTESAGIVELATNAETQAGTDASRAVTPASAASAFVKKSGDTLTGNTVVSVNTSGDALRITQTGTGNALFVEDSTNPDATPFVVNANGDVGIGTTDFTYGKLAVKDPDYAAISIQSSDASGVVGALAANGTNELRLTTVSSHPLVLMTNNTSRMRITATGNVGIGTQSPTEILDVAGNVKATGYVGLPVSSSTQLGIVELATNAETQAGTDATRAVTPAGLASAAALFVPPGAVLPFAMNAVPSGWLQANGAAVSRTTYAALFAAIGTIYGAGDGSTTFALPDLRGYFVRGHGTNADGTASGIFGDKQADAIVSHTHSYSAPSALVSDQHVGPGNFNVIGHVSITASNTGNTSTGVSAETRPKNIAMLYCIKF